MAIRKIVLPIIGIIALGSCASIPKGVEAVGSFDAKKYTGTWYEIARFDFRFEKNLNNVTATYSLNPNGTIKVENRGYNYVTQEWKQAIGKAKFIDKPQVAMLKVSFFGPFYSGYNVIALDDEYKYALVAGKNFSYLWILSRETTMPEEIKGRYLQLAMNLGFDTSKLIWTMHDKK
ncbi:MAG: lipocalin family protein [Bacteroidales bacterium]|nr:lipocalin family protein [Bacteroidales bacterium]